MDSTRDWGTCKKLENYKESVEILLVKDNQVET